MQINFLLDGLKNIDPEFRAEKTTYTILLAASKIYQVYLVNIVSAAFHDKRRRVPVIDGGAA